ncbi:MAG: KTSC domain-containing protein [Alcaligenaceae bacterium]|nr:MAG: KTSC domain-containing protein [Alcaligenaceae bacterium]
MPTLKIWRNPMQYLNSSAIHAVRYDSATGTLTVWFASGNQGYDYFQVPQSVYAGLLTAPSHGQYFHRHIRDQYAWGNAA